MVARIALRSDTAEAWAFWNPVLACGEAGWDTDNLILKIGDGSTPWNDLCYITEARA